MRNFFFLSYLFLVPENKQKKRKFQFIFDPLLYIFSIGIKVDLIGTGQT